MNLKVFYRASLLTLALTAHSAVLHAAVTAKDLEDAIQRNQWNEAAQIAQELLAKDSKSSVAKVKGAYSLFQGNFPNAALLLLSKISPAEWKNIPQGQDRFAEVMALYQKKVPLNLLPSRLEQINISDASPYLRDEILFAKGRQEFEKNNVAAARSMFESISKKSRLYAQARYHLATLAVKSGDLKTAASEFSKVFEPSVLDQSTEVWRDMSAQMTSHWGTNLKVMIDAELIANTTKAGELAVLGLARLAYAEKDFKAALIQYAKIDKASVFYARATLEKVWTLLALNQHEEAQKAASALSATDNSFESLEARTARALILVDIGQTEESRKELDSFLKIYETAMPVLSHHDTMQGVDGLPAFLQNDLQQDMRIRALLNYQNELKTEIKALRAEDHSLFPAYLNLAIGLEPLVTQSKDLVGRFVHEHVLKRKKDLERLNLQAKLIRVETYLEDREKLRAEYRHLHDADTAKQNEHDERLAKLLDHTVKSVDELLIGNRANDPRLEFRQSELLWELSTATSILSQTKGDEKQEAAANILKERSLKIAQHIVHQYPKFDKRAQAMFFSGYALSSLERTKESVATLEQYVQAYPQHAHVPDAYRILADIRFDANDFSQAQKLYEKILAFPESPIVGYALYKIGWSAYNLKDFARALLGLEKAVLWTTKSADAGQSLSLRREAQHDLITLYAEIGDHHKAQSYFSQFLHEDSGEWLAQLARELDRIGQFEKSGDLYQQLISNYPNAKENASYQAAIIHGLHQLHRWPAVIEATKQLVDRYHEQLVTPQAVDSPSGASERVVRDAVLAQHFEYKKRPSPDSAVRVATLDDLYLSAFQTWPTAEEPMYRHANLLIEQHKNAEAAATFFTHWNQFKASLKEPLREESLRNLIHALDEQEREQKTNALSKSAAQILEFSTEYEKDYSKTKHARSIAFLRPALLFKYGKTPEAVAESQNLFDINPIDEAGKRCFKNLRVAYYEKKNWQETYEWATKLSTRKSPGMNVYADDLKAIREESLFLWAENTTDDTKSAELFQKIAADPEMRRLKEKSLFNAYQRVQKSGQKIKAIQLADELEHASPQFEGLNAIAGMRGATYQEAGDYARAWPLFEAFLKHPDKSVPANILQQALLNSALMAEALGGTEIAVRHYNDYLKSSGPGSEEAKAGLERIQKKIKTEASYSPWAGLLKLKTNFEQKPIGPGSDLGARIKKSSGILESITKTFLDTASDKAVPTFYAFEAYCGVPLLYKTYSHALVGLAEAKGLKPQESAELKTELLKIAAPIDAKAKEMAAQCLTKSAEVEHDGPFYETVALEWGWRSDAGYRQKADEIINLLAQNSPWFDSNKNNDQLPEAELLKRHFEDKGDEDSWYALAKIRWDEKKPNLARLTLVDALGKKPAAGKLLNAYAVIEAKRHEHMTPLFEKAGQQGSVAAWANLALSHLKAARLAQAITALSRALETGAFDQVGDLKTKVQEFLKK